MTKAFIDLIETQRQKLEEARDALDNEVNERILNEQEEGAYPQNAFADIVIEQLAEAAVIAIPTDLSDDEHMLEHTFYGRLDKGIFDVWGSALFKCPGAKDLYELHLFATDYQRRDGFEEMETADYARMFKSLFRFFRYAEKGQLVEKMSPSHPAYPVVKRIYELTQASKIISIRSWLLTNRVFASMQKTGRELYENSIECTVSVIDLKYLADIRTGKIEINQEFPQGVNGVLLPKNEKQDYDCILSSISGTTLCQLYSNHGTSIVSANVRAYLGDRVKVNVGILNTIENEPSRFLAYNNGLVISADKAEFRDGKLYGLEGIQIINGGQTTASLHNAWLRARNSRKADRLTETDILERLRILQVPMKIIVNDPQLSDEERLQFRQKISSTSNSQNAVKLSDLAATEPFHQALSKAINNMRTPHDDCWFYESSRKLYSAEENCYQGNRVALNSFRKEHPKSKILGKDDLAIAYLAWRGEAQICARGKEQAFAHFNETFKSDPFFEMESGNPDNLPKAKVQALLCHWMLFQSLQKAVSRKNHNPIQSPRTVVVYTLALFGKKYGKKFHWDRMWSPQKPSELLLDKLIDMAHDVDDIITQNMGNVKKTVFCRQDKCWEILEKEFSFEGRGFEKVYELS